MPIRPVGNKRPIHWVKTAGWERKEETIDVWFETASGESVTDAKVVYRVNMDPVIIGEERIKALRILATYGGGMMRTGPRLSSEDKARLRAEIKKQLEDEAWSRSIEVKGDTGPPRAESLPFYDPTGEVFGEERQR
jgi:hypothetical protein